MTSPAEPAGPQRIAAGRFSLYADPDGRLVVSMAFDGEEETRHWVVPRALVRLAARQAGGDVTALVAALRAAAGGEG